LPNNAQDQPQIGSCATQRQAILASCPCETRGENAEDIQRSKGCGDVSRSFPNLSPKLGTAARTISDALRNEAIKCDELLAPFGKTITDATQSYLDHLKAISASQSVKHVIAALRAGRKADSRSIRYLRDLKYRLSKFEEDFGERQIADITTVEIENWLRALNLGPVSRNTFRRRLVTLFELAKDRGWSRTNPVLPTARVQEVSDRIGVLTPSEVAGLLAAASTETLPYWAIGAFAGLRASEIERLDWQDINAFIFLMRRAPLSKQTRNGKRSLATELRLRLLFGVFHDPVARRLCRSCAPRAGECFRNQRPESYPLRWGCWMPVPPIW
jgi:hypothetical protein